MVGDKERQFIAYLQGFAERGDRGALATLKRSLAFEPGAHFPSYRYVEPWVEGADGWRRETYYLVAGLYAMHPLVGSARMARAMAVLFRNKESQSLEGRLLALLDADRDQLPDRLRRAVALVASESLGIDWGQLLSDLLSWNRSDRRVQRQWARDFYRRASRDEETRKDDTEVKA